MTAHAVNEPSATTQLPQALQLPCFGILQLDEVSAWPTAMPTPAIQGVKVTSHVGVLSVAAIFCVLERCGVPSFVAANLLSIIFCIIYLG